MYRGQELELQVLDKSNVRQEAPNKYTEVEKKDPFDNFQFINKKGNEISLLISSGSSFIIGQSRTSRHRIVVHRYRFSTTISKFRDSLLINAQKLATNATVSFQSFAVFAEQTVEPRLRTVKKSKKRVSKLWPKTENTRKRKWNCKRDLSFAPQCI